MARIKRRQLKNKKATTSQISNPMSEESSPKKRVKRKPKRKYRSREVSPSWRPRYGCGRLHWNMRNHGYIDVRRTTRKKRVPKQTDKDAEKTESVVQVETINTTIADTITAPQSDFCHSSLISSENCQHTASMNTDNSAEQRQCADNSIAGQKASSNPPASVAAMDCEAECIVYSSENKENIPPERKHSSDMKVDTERCALSETNQNSTPGASSRPEISLTATDEAETVSTSFNSQIRKPDESCRLIYDDDGTSAATSIDKLKGVADDSLQDVTTVPENEVLLPPIYPWDNTNNNNNINNNSNRTGGAVKTISELKSSYSRGGNLPFRRCAMYATIRIHQIYHPSYRGSRVRRNSAAASS